MLGETIAVSEFVSRGVEVYSAAGPYEADLLVSVGGRKYAVQVKATLSENPKWQFRFRGMNNRNYPKGVIDWFVAVHLPSRKVALVPAGEANSCTVDFENINPEWDFDTGVARMREGGTG